MSLSDLASLGTFVSSLAVLISLIYVAIQIRQTERNQRAMVLQGRAARISSVLVEFAHPDLAAVMAKGRSAKEDLTQTELTQFQMIVRATMTSFEDSFLQRREKLLNDEAFESQAGAMRNMFQSPGARRMWALSRDTYGPEFRIFVDGIVAEAAHDPAPDILASWNALADEK